MKSTNLDILVEIYRIQEYQLNQEQTFFEYAAEVGLKKHLGGVGATDELVFLCQITPDSYVLDVGCGAGVTASYLVKKYGCRVVGVDIDWKNGRALTGKGE